MLESLASGEVMPSRLATRITWRRPTRSLTLHRDGVERAREGLAQA